MATGLIALLDDVAAIARVAAASLDDVAGQAAKAGAKAAGVVIDDGAVTPQYVVGFAAEREVPIVARIAVGSLRNKLIVLLPLALLLTAFAPSTITPLLTLGGLFLCYEGAEKVWEALFPHAAHEHEAEIHGHSPDAPLALDAKVLEDEQVAGAIKTDLILSAEIMAIALAELDTASLWSVAIVLALVGIAITVAVYGAVALIVKADDFGVYLVRGAGASAAGALRASIGRSLVAGMPILLRTLSVVGTAAMIWVGGGIVVHGLAYVGADQVEHLIHGMAAAASGAVSAAQGVVDWTVRALGSGIFGLTIGAVTIPVVGKVVAPLWLSVRGRLRPQAGG